MSYRQMKKNSFILLIDDDPIANYLNERLIRSLQITDEILVALNGDQALSIIKEKSDQGNGPPDLIILDINMPVMNGLEFLQVFYTGQNWEHGKTKLAVLTTSTHQRDYTDVGAFGVKNILHKPLTPEKILAVINNENG